MVCQIERASGIIEQRKPITARKVVVTKMGLRYFQRVSQIVWMGVFLEIASEREREQGTGLWWARASRRSSA